MVVFAALIAIGCLPWIAMCLANARMAWSLRALSDVEPARAERWPKLSIIVPAMNEADTIEPALRSLLALDYPELEIELVNDRSTGGTQEVIHRVAGSDPRLRVIDIERLPAGWLGKVHAMNRGFAVSDGDVVLFTDADVQFAPLALRRAVAWLEQEGLDHLSVIPALHSRSVLASLVIAAAMRVIALSQRPWHAGDPKWKEAIGSGAFNMVRRSSFLRSPGFEWLRMEVADDIGLGHMMKLGGGRSGVLLGPKEVRVEWYPTLRSAFRGLEKNAFAQIARFSVARGLTVAAVSLVVTSAPFLAFLPLGVPGLAILGGVSLFCHLLGAILIARLADVPLWAMVLASPFGDLLISTILVRATILGARRGGLIWRGTVYPTAALRAGMRVRF